MNKFDCAIDLLSAMGKLLNEHGERNWIRGIYAALDEMHCTNGDASDLEFSNAQSIYLTMTSGGAGFSDFNIWLSDSDERVLANQLLDDLRVALWETFRRI